MNFAATQDIEAPAAFVFKHVSDFSTYERQALRRGADVRRRDTLSQPGVGMGWDVTFSFRGKDRTLSAEIVNFDDPNGYTVDSLSSGIDGTVVVELIPLSRSRTRLNVKIDLAAKSLASKLMLQSLKLAKGSLNNRFTTRVASMAKEIEERYAKR